MPPAYKPLTSAGGITGAPGLPPEIFGAPTPITFQGAEQINALQLAQELQNQNNQIAVQQRQQQQDYQNQVRDSLQHQFAGQDPGNIDPGEAMKTAYRIAAHAGDLDTMLNIEKATKERANSQAYGPQERQILSQMIGQEVPENTTPQFANTLASLYGKNLYGQQLQNTQDNREADKEAMLPEGYYGNPTKKGAEEFRSVYKGTELVNSNLDALEASLERTGNAAATGAEYVLQRQLVGDLALALKSPAFGNLGAALSPSEFALLTTQLPALISTPGFSLGDFLVERGMGRDPQSAIAALRSKMSTLRDVTQKTNRVYKKEDQGASSFSIPGASGQSGDRSIFSSPPPLVDYGTSKLPTNQHGGKLSREEFYAQHPELLAQSLGGR